MITTPAKALEGLRVLDVTQVMAGPFCTMLLCDMGADVIKIEPPAGDSSRRMAGAIGSASPSFNAVNRGKRGVSLNLKSSAGANYFKTVEMLEEDGKKCYPIEKVIACCNWILSSDRALVSGRNFSSVFDPWEDEKINSLSRLQ